MKTFILTICFLAMLLLSQTLAAIAQDYPVTIQGNLKDGSVPANGTYDLRATFFASETGGSVVDIHNFLGVQITNGLFTVTMSSSDQTFTSAEAPLWIEYGMRPGGTSVPFTPLLPRQRVAYAPLAIRSHDAESLGGTSHTQFVKTNDPRLSDPRPPTAGSNSYIQNLALNQTQTGNFAVSGSGRAAILEAAEFRIAFASRLLSATTNGSNNLQLGIFTGSVELPGTNSNSFIGWSAGRSTTTGSGNTFVGASAGQNLTTGTSNAFLGASAGRFSSSAVANTFVGASSGFSNDTGNNNSFFGFEAGKANGVGWFNSAFGEHADFSNGSLNNATAIGAKAFVSQSHSLVLGSINGVNGATADTKVGIGTTAPADKLHVNGGSIRVTNGGIYIANPNTLVITSPNGACWGITVNNSGAIGTFPITPCP